MKKRIDFDLVRAVLALMILIWIAWLLLGCSKDDDLPDTCRCETVFAYGRTWDIKICPSGPSTEEYETLASIEQLEIAESNSDCR